MALINQKTGYSGFTLDGLGGTSLDEHGRVKKCIFSIVYPIRNLEVDFSISKGEDDWGAQMGDGTIIPLSNPVVLFANRDNSVIEFDMSVAYACNSPCILVYRSDSAAFRITDSDRTAVFVPNSVTGHFAFTVEGYGGGTYDNGNVDRIVATIPFPIQSTNVNFTLTDNPEHWGARMGDGSIINLKEPVVLFTNRDNAVVQFTMATPYPSNSPCILVYRSADAKYHLEIRDEDDEFIPVKDITDVPTNIAAGIYVDLSVAEVKPYNASVQGIKWTIVSGPATVDGDRLIATGGGNIELKATIAGALEEGKKDYTKTFKISAGKNTIIVSAQPSAEMSLIVNEINAKLSVVASSTTGNLTYKWYHNTSASTSGATLIAGATESSYTIPPSTNIGTHYYYCIISSLGASTVTTIFSKVSVYAKLTGIKISPRITNLGLSKKEKLNATQLPENAAAQKIVWSSSDNEVIQVDEYGTVFAVGPGTARITAKAADTSFQDFIEINVAAHVPVTFINNIITKIDTDTEYLLTGTPVPSNATSKDITWSLISAGDTNAKLVDNKLSATKIGTVVVRATINNGAGLTTDYVQDTKIEVVQKFIPVTDIIFSGIPAKPRAEDVLEILTEVVPANASHKLVTLELVHAGPAGATLADNKLSAKNEGMCLVRATVTGGKSESEAFTKDLTVTFLPKWVPVESISRMPVLFEHIELPLYLNGAVYPENATMKDIIYTLESPSGANATMDKNNALHIDYENVTWWVKNPNPTPPNYYDQWLEGVTDSIVVGVRVKDGIKEGEDFTMKFNIGIQLPESPDIHIPIEKVQLQLPSILRSHRPILMSKVIKTPWNATNGSIMMDFVRADTDAPGFGIAFTPSDESEEYWSNEYGIKMDSEYSWTEEGFYMYSMEDIKAKLNFSVLNGNEDGTMYTQTDILQFLPEYIPVKNIYNMPTEIPYNAKVYLSPDIDTKFTIKNDSTEVYDVEIPSYSDIVWSVVSAGTTGAKFTDGILSFTRSGTCTIQAEIPQGTHEAYTWYDREFDAVSYKQRFTIQVTSAESSTSKPIVTLKLSNGNTVKAYKVWDFYNLCNTLPSDASLTINGTTFRKDQVTEVEFWDMVPTFQGSDTTVPITNITLSKSALGVNTIVTPPAETTKDFDLLFPSGSQEDLELVNDPSSPYDGMWLTGNNFCLKPNGDIVNIYGIDPSPEFTASEPVGTTPAGYVKVNVQGSTAAVNGCGFYKLGEPFQISTDDRKGWAFVEWEPSRNYSFDNIRSKTAMATINESYTGKEITIKATWGAEPHTWEKAEFSVTAAHPNLKFKIDPNKVIFPESFTSINGITKYDNGYIELGRETHISETGSLVVFDENLKKTEITVHGVVLTDDDATALLPKGSKIGERCVIIDNKYVYRNTSNNNKWNSADVKDSGSSTPSGIDLPDNSYLLSGKTIKIPTNTTNGAQMLLDDASPEGSNTYIHFINSIGDGTILTETGWIYTDKGVLVDSFGNIYNNKMVLDSTNVTVSPTNSTKKVDDIVWTVSSHRSSDKSLKLSQIVLIPKSDGSGNIPILVPGSDWESALLTATAPSGQAWHGQDYVKKIPVAVGDISSMGTTVTGINTNYAVKILFASYRTQFINLSASLVGVNVSSFNQSNIKWSISGNKGSSTLFSSSYWGGSTTATGATTTLRIMRNETAGTDLKVKVTAGNAETIILIKMISEYADQPAITSLRNFGVNFTNLTKIDRIPDVVTGDDCLKNFLAGCVKFNQKIEIPEFVEGDRCLKNFLGGCTSFNQEITIPEDVNGVECLSRFLAGCTSFNKPITIPEGVTGVGCLMRFLEKCKSFNQLITIPANVAGKQCLDHFMYGCETFNRPITIPDSVSGVAALRGFMRDTMKMTSPITISEIAAETVAANGITLACFRRDDAYDVGVPIVGTGADIFREKFVNMVLTVPLRRLI